MCPRLEAEIEEAHLKAKEEMMQGIQMAKEVAQKELSDQKALYEDRIQALEKELVCSNSSFINKSHMFPVTQFFPIYNKLCVYLLWSIDHFWQVMENCSICG